MPSRACGSTALGRGLRVISRARYSETSAKTKCLSRRLKFPAIRNAYRHADRPAMSDQVSGSATSTTATESDQLASEDACLKRGSGDLPNSPVASGRYWACNMRVSGVPPSPARWRGSRRAKSGFPGAPHRIRMAPARSRVRMRDACDAAPSRLRACRNAARGQPECYCFGGRRRTVLAEMVSMALRV